MRIGRREAKCPRRTARFFLLLINIPSAIDELTKVVQYEAPLVQTIFADDVILVVKNINVLGVKLGHWHEILKIIGLKIKRDRKEFLELRF